MKPLIHARYSKVKHGGHEDDYLKIHEFIDSSKAHVPDMRHRAILHSSFGIYIAQEVFGYYITNSEGKQVSVRDVAEEHVIQDLGTIPTVQDWLSSMPLETWMGGPEGRKKTRRVPFLDRHHDEGELQAFIDGSVNYSPPAHMARPSGLLD